MTRSDNKLGIQKTYLMEATFKVKDQLRIDHGLYSHGGLFACLCILPLTLLESLWHLFVRLLLVWSKQADTLFIYQGGSIGLIIGEALRLVTAWLVLLTLQFCWSSWNVVPHLSPLSLSLQSQYIYCIDEVLFDNWTTVNCEVGILPTLQPFSFGSKFCSAVQASVWQVGTKGRPRILKIK